MALSKEEIAADLVWRYVEHVRGRQEGEEAAALSRAELEQLVEVLHVAAAVPSALGEPAGEERRAAVRGRVEQVLARDERRARPPVAAEAPGARPGRAPGTARVVPAWRFHAALAAAAALAAVVGTVGVWHRPPVPVRVVVKNMPELQPLEEGRAHELLPRMVRNELTPSEEKNLMGHMLVCPGCFDEYVQLKHGQAARTPARARAVRFVGR